MPKKKDEKDVVELLTPMQEAFCRYFADPESDSYGNAFASAKRAGYAEAFCKTSSWKLMRHAGCRERIRQIYDEADWGVGHVLSNMLSNRKKADEKGDFATVARIDELLAKRLGMLSDRLITATETPDREEALTESQQREARILTQLRHRTDLLPHEFGIESPAPAEPAPTKAAEPEPPAVLRFDTEAQRATGT